MKHFLVFLILPLLISCRTVAPKDAGSSKLNHAANCSFLQRVSPLPGSCGNGNCQKLLGENQDNCPQDCRDPLASVTSYYAQSHVCKEPTRVHHPASLEELSRIVKDIRARNNTIKAIGTLHSITDIKCPNHGEVVAMESFHNILGIEDYKGVKTVLFEPNIRFWDLLSYLSDKGYALDKRFPGFGGISVAGFIATGAHGSDTKNSATISSSIVSLEIMGADGNVQLFDRDNTTKDEWGALTANLGILGIVTRARLEVRPAYKMAMKIKEFSAELLNNPEEFMREANACDFAFVHYLRGVQKIYFTCGQETDQKLTHESFANTLFLPPSPSLFNNIAVGSFQQAACDDTIARFIESTIDSKRRDNPWLTWTDDAGKVHHEREGVGHWYKAMEAIFSEETQPKFSQVDWEVAVPARHFAAVLGEMQQFMERYNVIIPTIGVIFRFDRATGTSIMAPGASDSRIAEGEALVHIEMPVFSPFGLNEEQVEFIRQPYRNFFLSLIEKYDARPHYGKNDNKLFLSSIVASRMKESYERFNAVKARMEPTGAFSNDFARGLGIR